MEAITELINLITQKRIKKVELFDENNRNKSSNYYKLFDGIHSQQYATDQEAAQDIYGCDASEKKYLILKSRLKQKLLNTLFFLDIREDKEFSPQKAALYECNRMLYHAQVLFLNNSFEIAMPIIDKAYKKAQEFELTRIEYECISLLMQNYARQNQYQDFMNTKNTWEVLGKRLQAEHNAELLLQEAMLEASRAKARKKTAEKVATKALNQISQILKQHPSKRIQHNLFRVKVLQEQIQQDYAQLIQTLQTKEDFLQQNPEILSQAALERIYLARLSSYLHNKDYKSGESYYAAISSKVEESSDTWYQLQEIRVLLAMHCLEYIAAANIFSEVLSQNNFRLLSDNQKEHWKVIQAYLHYVYKTHKIREIRGLIQNSKLDFKLSTYLEEYPEFSKEKRGLNIAKLSSQLLFYLDRHDLAGASTCIEFLTHYKRRYPKKDLYYRSECFIAMLNTMEEEQFKFYQTQRANHKFLSEISSISLQQDDDLSYEVLPFEQIWYNIAELLKQN